MQPIIMPPHIIIIGIAVLISALLVDATPA